MIEAYTLGHTGESAFVSAMPSEAWQPPPHGTISAQFVFPVAASATVFSVVVRRPLGSLKQVGSSVEIDLNCC